MPKGMRYIFSLPRLLILGVCFLLFPRFATSNELSRCCSGGSKHFKEQGNCISVRAVGSSHSCNRAGSICCLRSLIDASCQAGVLYAQRHKVCSAVNINELAGGVKRECCDCCLLARELSEREEPCIAPTGFSPDCLDAFNKCCNQTLAVNKPFIGSSQVQSVGLSIDVEGVENASGCASAKCEHLCTIREDGTSQCGCRSGFDLAPDGRSCVDIDECLLLVDDCLESQRCLNTPGAYKCIRTKSCGTGYAMDSETEQCVDVDECTLGAHDCGPMYQCKNTQGSFRCVPKRCEDDQVLDPGTGECKSVNCPPGYKPRDGRCEDIDECREKINACPVYEECVNTPGSFRCQEQGNVCSNGYYMDRESGFCLDIDECQRGTHTCSSTDDCINLPGIFRCKCSPGFEFNEFTMRCEDIDECIKFSGHACSLQADCVNSIGSYQCICKPGFSLASDNRSCDDINECALGIAKCQQKCINSPGSYQCICDRGYQLGIDEITCEDIDECQIWAKSGNELCMGKCVNTPGSFLCTCPEGYQVMSDGITCKDIDECSENLNFCELDQICINLLGSFKCERIACPRNYIPDRTFKNQVEDGYSCIKHCHINDAICLSNYTREILFQFRSVPSMRILKKPIEISRITTKINSSVFNIEYIINGENARNFFVEQLGNVGILHLSTPIRGPRTEKVRLHINVMSRKGVSIAHNLALIEIYVSRWNF